MHHNPWHIASHGRQPQAHMVKKTEKRVFSKHYFLLAQTITSLPKYFDPPSAAMLRPLFLVRSHAQSKFHYTLYKYETQIIIVVVLSLSFSISQFVAKETPRNYIYNDHRKMTTIVPLSDRNKIR